MNQSVKWSHPLEQDGVGIAVDFAPGGAFGEAIGQRSLRLDADEMDVTVVELAFPAGIGQEDGEVVLDVLLALDLVAIVDPVANGRPAVPGQITTPIV